MANRELATLPDVLSFQQPHGGTQPFIKRPCALFWPADVRATKHCKIIIIKDSLDWRDCSVVKSNGTRLSANALVFYLL